ncbi:oligosaccharide flippase family protein [Marinobacter hydrocarbonoclasticus]|nr:oligosaccharide flippase family protein [Marinobacter nauticus]
MGRAALWYGLATLVSRGTGFIILPLYGHFLTVSEYGQMGLLSAFGSLLSGVLLMGLSDTSLRYASRPECGGQVLALSLVVLASLAVLLTPVLLLVSGDLPGDVLPRWVVLLMLSLIAGTVITLTQTWARIDNQPLAFALIALALGTGQLLWVCLALWLSPGIDGVLLAGVLASVPVALGAIGWHLKRHPLCWRPSEAKALLRYGAPLAVSAMLIWVLNGYERPWIAQLVGLETLAAITLAGQFALVAVLLCEPFNLWWFANRFRLLDEEDYWRHNLGTLLALLWLCGALILTYIAAILLIPLLFPAPLHEAKQHLPWMLLLAGARQITATCNVGIYYRPTGDAVLRLNIIWALGALVLIPLTERLDSLIALMMVLSFGRAVHFHLASQDEVNLRYPWLLGWPLALTLLMLVAQWWGAIDLLGNLMPVWFGLFAVVVLLGVSQARRFREGRACQQ